MLALYSPALPHIFIAAMALLLLMVGVFAPAHVAAARVRAFAVLTLVAAFALFAVVWVPNVPQFVFPRLTGPSGFMAVLDNFSFIISSLILLFSAGSILLAGQFLTKHKRHHFEYYVLMLLSTLGMLVMVSAQDLLILYIGLELMSFCLYILAAFLRDDAKSSEAALKYFIMGSLASGLTLYGLSLLYGLAGGTGFPEVAHALSSAATPAAEGLNSYAGIVVAVVLTLTGLVFKISAAPFHMWTPDVYEGAPTPVTAFMATAPKVAAFALLLRILHEVMAPMQLEWQQILAVLAVLTMGVGSLMALLQDNLKRLLAYSSIGHVGFMLVGAATAQAAGMAGVVFYLAAYSVMTLGAFSVLLAIQFRGTYAEKISHLAGLGAQAPWLAFALMVFMFSLAGMPPLVGFFAKFVVFQAAVNAGLVWLALFGVGFSVVAAYYALKVIKTMYFDQGEVRMEGSPPKALVFLINLCLILVVVLGLFPTTLMNLSTLAVSSLF